MTSCSRYGHNTKGPLLRVFLLVDSVARCLWWPEKDGLTHFTPMLWQCVCLLFKLRLLSVAGGGLGNGDVIVGSLWTGL